MSSISSQEPLGHLVGIDASHSQPEALCAAACAVQNAGEALADKATLRHAKNRKRPQRKRYMPDLQPAPRWEEDS